MRSVLHGILVICLAASTALADKNQTSASTQLVEQGMKEYNLGNFDAAIAAFEQAYRIEPDPNVLFDLGQAHRNKPQPDYPKAIFYFRSYIANKPRAKDRAEVEDLIKQLEQLSAQQEASAKQ